MVSKYTATVGLSQKKMDSLSEFEPIINDSTKFKTVSQIVQYFLDGLASGKYVEKSSITTKEIEQLITEEKRQKILNLKIRNRKELIHNLKVPPTEAVAITNGYSQIEKSSSALARYNPEHEFTGESPIDNARSPVDISLSDGKWLQFRCTDCGFTDETLRFDSTRFSSFDTALANYRVHLRQKHNDRECTNAEKIAVEKLTEGCRD